MRAHTHAQVVRAALQARRQGGPADTCRRPGCGATALRYERSGIDATATAGDDADAANAAAGGGGGTRCVCRLCGWLRPEVERAHILRRLHM